MSEPELSQFQQQVNNWCDKQEGREESESLKSVNPAAAIELLRLMESISEDCWHSIWMDGLHDDLAEFVAEDRACLFGMGEVTQQQINELRRLSQACGGWWKWEEDEDLTFSVGGLTNEDQS